MMLNMRKTSWEISHGVPFHIDVAHALSSNAGFIQNYIGGVPHDDTQKIPDRKKHWTWVTDLRTRSEQHKPSVSLFGLAWWYVERRSRRPEALGKNVNPHLKSSLENADAVKNVFNVCLTRVKCEVKPAGASAGSCCTEFWSPRVLEQDLEIWARVEPSVHSQDPDADEVPCLLLKHNTFQHDVICTAVLNESSDVCQTLECFWG